jgi:3-isopropylmalate/(R)-2-methylmalate dehydratase small subunit
MEPFTRHTGIAVPLDKANVDTDQMVPKQFIVQIPRKQGFGKALFYDWRFKAPDVPDPEFVFNRPAYQGATVLLGKANFGCGSSREHAAWAVKDYGFRVVIAPSFAEIFFKNALNNGIVLIALPDSVIEALFAWAASHPGAELTVDLESQRISDGGELDVAFEIEPYRKMRLLKGLDEVGLILEHEADIVAYEKAHDIRPPRMFGTADIQVFEPT